MLLLSEKRLFFCTLKTHSSPWIKWCPPNYPVQRGNRPLCCPPATPPGVSALLRQGEESFYQNRSSRLWPVPCCRGQTTGSCQSPEQKIIEKNRKELEIIKHFVFACLSFNPWAHFLFCHTPVTKTQPGILNVQIFAHIRLINRS